jgi:soluble lytic murein transglycosylase-like protein
MSDADVVYPAPSEPDAAGQQASNTSPSPRPTPRIHLPNRKEFSAVPPSEAASTPGAPATGAQAVGSARVALPAAQVRPELRNWAVLDVETNTPVQAIPAPAELERAPTETELEAANAAPTIEGTARVVDERPAAETDAPPEETGAPSPLGSDQIDSILIAGLPHREVHVEPGGKATLVVSLLNNGPAPALFDVHLEGWVHESWLEGDAQRRLQVQPGERAALPITIAPPRDGGVTAGSFPLIVVVRSPQYPKRRTRLAATLVVQPFTDFALGKLEPATTVLGAFRRTAHFALPVSNMGNHPLRLSLQGQMLGLRGQVEFTDALETGGKKGPAWLASPATLNLAPRQTAELYVRASIKGAPVLAARPLPAVVRVAAAAEEERRLPRSAAAEIAYRPPLRPWHLIAAVTTSFVVLVGAGLLALTARLLLSAPPVVETAQAAAPAPIVIVLNQTAPAGPDVAQLMPGQPGVQAGAPSAAAPAAAPASAAPIAPQAGANANVPLVVPSQITRPGEAAPVSDSTGGPVVSAQSVTQPGQQAAVAAAPVAVAPAPIAPAAAPARQMTYAEMFRDVALQYDLDWRLLAAQAYIESGFDSLALGNDGDMGLMQILPGTWREWAPAVNAGDPFDAYSNVLVAAAYHDYLRTQLGKRGLPQAQWMLVAYNWGIDRLGDFLDAGGTWEELPAVRRGYAEDILRIARTIP